MEFTKQIIIEETNEHKEDISFVTKRVVEKLLERAEKHDHTKYENPELLALALNERQNGNKAPMKEWIKYHSQEDHHMEHFTNPNEMNLLQALEICIDGACATYRRIKNKPCGIEDQKQYYLKEGFCEEMANIMANTFMLARQILIENEKELNKRK